MMFLEEEILMWEREWFADDGYDSKEETEDEIEETYEDDEFQSGESSDEEEWVMEMEEWMEARRWTELQ